MCHSIQSGDGNGNTKKNIYISPERIQQIIDELRLV